MATELTHFRIEKLHGNRTINVHIQDNKLVLVGENGTGKSTLANFIYFFLTAQWDRMNNYEFSAIYAVINNTEVEITQEDIKVLKTEEGTKRLLKGIPIPPSAISRFEYLIRHTPVDELANSNELLRFADLYDIPYPHLLDALFNPLPLDSKNASKRETATSLLQSLVTEQILYLPTYRRIERELHLILADNEHEVRSILPGTEYTRRKLVQKQLRQRSRDSKYIELVEFGMEDVQETIRSKMNEIKDNVRSGLSTLTGTYLRDVIQNVYKESNFQIIRELNETTINAIFSRIDEKILPKSEQESLKRIIEKINTDDSIQENDKVVGHFLTQLIEQYMLQQEKEKDIIEFVKVCNVYLRSKRMIYDNLSFSIRIQQEGDLEKDTIDLQMLSSGEKQIVSLFSHIYLSGGNEYFVIIDEPELSLSVPWQRRFLPDILASGKCTGLVAVTHSPFIFENELDAYTHSLGEFISTE